MGSSHLYATTLIVESMRKQLFDDYDVAATAGTLGTVLFIECLGLERLTSVWGITRMFMGISVLFGAPIAATIESSTHDYAYAFLYSGLCFVLSSCVMMVIPVVLKERVRNV